MRQSPVRTAGRTALLYAARGSAGLILGAWALWSPCRAAAPAHWSRATRPWGEVLTPPESDTHVAIVDAGKAATPQAAVAAAWALFRPGFVGKLQAQAPSPAADGWDEAWDFTYLTQPNARRDVEAIPRRAGAAWTVVLLDGSDPTLEKRRADLRLILQGVKPKGFVPESFAGRTAHTLDAARIAALIAFARDGMRLLGVPGVGLALIDRGRIVYEGGFGVRELGKPAGVDAHTRFMIASNTKGMTTLLLARLVDEKKLRWDEKVTDAYPGFRLGDAAVTQRVQMRHLVCACTGLPRQDLEWFFKDTAATPASATFTMLAAMQPTTAFGETYQYSNLMAAAAGYVGAVAAHPGRDLAASYDRAMQTMIFAPLEMRDTIFDFSVALAGDHASPHGNDIDGRVAVASPDLNVPIIGIRPAGGAWSSAHDMALYVLNELTQGKLPDGKQLVSPANLLARRAPQVSMGGGQTYGMGLRVDTAHGVAVVHHGGSLAGYSSDFFAIPSADMGAVILTNADRGGLLLAPFLRRLLELLYDGKPKAGADLAASATAAGVQWAAQRAALTVPPDATLASQLAARYTNPVLGHIDVRRAGASVSFDFGAWRSHVASRRNGDGTVSFVTIDPAATGKTFVVTPHASRRGLIVRDGQHEYIYMETAR